MGFSAIAGHFVWAVALVGALSAGAAQLLHAWDVVHEGIDAKREARTAALETRLADATYCYRASRDRIEVVANNTGASALRLGDVSFVVDGKVLAGFSAAVGGAAGASFWQPGDVAFFNHTGHGATPGALVLVTGNGVRAFPPLVTCIFIVHVEALATYDDSGAPASTFRLNDLVEGRATIHDEDGDVVQGASVTFQFVNPSGVVRHTGVGTTDASGVASVSYTIPPGANKGTWTLRVTDVAGSSLVYDADANVVAQVTFQVV